MTRTSQTWSRRMSFILRHDPASAGLELDPAGWCDIVDLVAGVPGLDHDTLRAVVATDSKSRFTIEGERIRAAQGHTTAVDAVGRPQVPPATLFHGTTAFAADSIEVSGLHAGSRRDVHLARDVETATTVGARRGTPVVLTVDAVAAHAAGIEFRIADNGVWLTTHVPAEFITR
jgi:putative RNA 2'-phosphotransferase